MHLQGSCSILLAPKFQKKSYYFGNLRSCKQSCLFGAVNYQSFDLLFVRCFYFGRMIFMNMQWKMPIPFLFRSIQARVRFYFSCSLFFSIHISEPPDMYKSYNLELPSQLDTMSSRFCKIFHLCKLESMIMISIRRILSDLNLIASLQHSIIPPISSSQLSQQLSFLTSS